MSSLALFLFICFVSLADEACNWTVRLEETALITRMQFLKIILIIVLFVIVIVILFIIVIVIIVIVKFIFFIR